MKYLDDIEIITDKYENLGIPKGTKGAIIMPEIRHNTFMCELFNVSNDNETPSIRIDGMKVTRSSDLTDAQILEDLPLHDPHWWCKVEDGYILNLLGERKNKIPYDYDS